MKPTKTEGGFRFYTQLDNLHSHVETLESEMCKEVQNGRLFRLMTKLAAINERPDFNMESTWSETGDRYIESGSQFSVVQQLSCLGTC